MLIPEPYNEKKVLQLLAQGSEFAFTLLFDHYRGRIFSVAWRFLKSRTLAEEIVQEVFLKIWLRRREMPGILNFEGYLFTMARNQIFDSLKRIAAETTAKRAFTERLQFVEDTDHAVIDKEYDELLREAVDHLPPQQKQIFRMAKIEGLSHQAIAEQLHISRLTVKTHMAKALQTIRHNLRHHFTTFSLSPIIFQLFDRLF